jgi:hypothetical protein
METTHIDRKSLIRAATTLITLDREFRAGVLDQEGQLLRDQALAALATRPGDEVAAIFLDWQESPVRFDPRRPKPTSAPVIERTGAGGRPVPRLLR